MIAVEVYTKLRWIRKLLLMISLGVTSVGLGKTRIGGIAFVGNKKVATNALMQAINTEIGQELDKSRLAQDVLDLYELGYFTNIQVFF